MDERKNPYAPGAGTPPPELAGRGQRAAARAWLTPQALDQSRHLKGANRGVAEFPLSGCIPWDTLRP